LHACRSTLEDPPLDAEGVPEEARRILAGALNYLFKSIDLIPDGIDDIGYLDDAFVLRVAAAHAVTAGHPSEGEVAALAAGAALLRDFLDADYPRLERYVAGLRKVVARGRSVDAIVHEGSTRRELVEDVSGFARGGTELEFVIMVIAVSCVKLLSAHNSTQHTSRKHKV
jgi:Protein of unknown function (DUF1232).